MNLKLRWWFSIRHRGYPWCFLIAHIGAKYDNRAEITIRCISRVFQSEWVIFIPTLVHLLNTLRRMIYMVLHPTYLVNEIKYL